MMNHVFVVALLMIIQNSFTLQTVVESKNEIGTRKLIQNKYWIVISNYDAGR